MRSHGLICMLVSLALFGCRSDPGSVDDQLDPASAPGGGQVISGVIAKISSNGFPIEVHVQNGESSSGTTYEEIVVAVWDSTLIYRENPDGSLTRGNMSDLVVGDSIRAFHTGALRKSLPPQVDATKIEVKPSVSP